MQEMFKTFLDTNVWSILGCVAGMSSGMLLAASR
jgi:hypothetical protein